VGPAQDEVKALNPKHSPLDPSTVLRAGPRHSTRQRRVIYVGTVAYRGATCPICPGHAMIYPAAAMPAHLARHDLTLDERNNFASPHRPTKKVRYTGGRTPGVANKTSSNGRGVEKRKGIRAR